MSLIGRHLGLLFPRQILLVVKGQTNSFDSSTTSGFDLPIGYAQLEGYSTRGRIVVTAVDAILG